MIVVTGAAGLIGSAIVRHLNSLGYKNLIVVDELNHPIKDAHLKGKLYLEHVSIQALYSWLEGRHSEILAIFHLGACSDTLETRESFLKENNTLYTRRLAEYCLHHGIQFIYASSAATYGDGRLGFSDDHHLLPQLNPLNLYGWSKHWFDLWALEEGVLDQIVGLKYFNVFGPNESHKGHMASMVFKMVPIAKKEGVIRLFRSTDPQFADGAQCRDFIYVKAAARMSCQFLNDPRKGIFNIGSGHRTTWNELAQAVFKALDQPICIEYIDMPENLAHQYQNDTCAVMDKYGKQTHGYTTQSAVQDYVQNYLIPGRVW